MARSFENSDPKEKQQKIATAEILAYLYIANAINGAYFFAYRLCEYSQTKGTQKNIITPKTVTFRQRNKRITNQKMFHTATTVSITFIKQKNDNNYETITQHKKGHVIQDPVAIWARIIINFLDIPGATINTTTNFF